MSPASKAHMEATARYEAKAYDKILVRVPKGAREEWQQAAERDGKSLNRFICDCVEDHIPVKK